MPISFRQAFAAGAASVAAGEAGKNEHEQLAQAQVAGLMVDEVDAKEAGRKAAAGQSRPAPGSSLAASWGLRGGRGEEVAVKRRRHPQHPESAGPEGPLRRLARFLRLRT